MTELADDDALVGDDPVVSNDDLAPEIESAAERIPALAPIPTFDPIGEQENGERASLAASISELAEQVRSFHARAEARERVIDQLHAELERRRGGEQALLLRPVVTDLQRLRGDLLHQAETLPPATDSKQAAELLVSFALSVELALERCGSVPIRPEHGSRFSAREHRAVKIVAAAHPDDDGTIEAVLADGYLDIGTGRTTVPARVHVRRWDAPAGAGETDGGPGHDHQNSTQQESNADV